MIAEGPCCHPEGVDRSEFLRKHPRLWHVADARCWPTIPRHGLFSAARLVELFRRGDAGELLSRRRAEPVVLEHPDHGYAVLRDQGPLNEKKLASALTNGWSVERWLRQLNDLVFLFPDGAARDKLIDKYGQSDLLVLTLNTRSLLIEYDIWLKVASINTGATVYAAQPRGDDTYRSVDRHEARKPVKEVVVAHAIPDVADHLISAELRRPSGERLDLRS